MTLDIAQVRSHFPALKQEQVFLDNAGVSSFNRSLCDFYPVSSALLIS